MPKLCATVLYYAVNKIPVVRSQALVHGHVEQVHELIADSVEIVRLKSNRS
jgi:hypothetical protein